MLYILYGGDDYSRRQELNAIIKGNSDNVIDGTNVTYIDGPSVSSNELKVACQTVPFLSDKRVVVVQGLLGRFEPKEKHPVAKKTAKSSDETKDWQQFADAVNGLPDTTVLVLIDGEISSKNLLLPAVSDKAKVIVFSPFKNREVPEWIRKEVSRGGGKISIKASEYLAKLVGNDLWTLSNEIAKLLAYTGNRTIEEKDIRLLVTHAQDTNIFTLLDAIMEGKTNAAQEILAQVLKVGMSPAYVITMLGRQLRLAILMKDLTSLRKTRSEIQAKLSLADFAFQKTEEQSAKYTQDQLRDFYSRLLETDVAIKTGKYDEELALTILVAEMSHPSSR